MEAVALQANGSQFGVADLDPTRVGRGVTLGADGQPALGREALLASAATAVASQGGAILLCDIDNLKTVNDMLGHHAGDVLLEQVADRLREGLRDGDVAARIGGDEFAVLLPGLDGIQALAVAERVHERLAVAYAVAGRELRATATIGVAAAAEDAGEPTRLLQNADMAMYLAKSGGRRRIELYDPAMHARVLERLQLRQDLEDALDRGELRLVYQPIVRLADGRARGVESLPRWDHAVLGTVSPAAFIPMLEESGHIVEVGAWLLREAVHQLAAWQRADSREVSPSTLQAKAVGDRRRRIPTRSRQRVGASAGGARLMSAAIFMRGPKKGCMRGRPSSRSRMRSVARSPRRCPDLHPVHRRVTSSRAGADHQRRGRPRPEEVRRTVQGCRGSRALRVPRGRSWWRRPPARRGGWRSRPASEATKASARRAAASSLRSAVWWSHRSRVAWTSSTMRSVAVAAASTVRTNQRAQMSGSPSRNCHNPAR